MKRLTATFMALIPAISILAVTPAEKAAEVAAKTYIAAMEKGNVAEVYSLLPKSYQKDVVDVVQAFGNTMDADIWKEARSVFAALADIGIAKPAIVAQMAGDKLAPDVNTAEAVEQSALALKGLSEKLSLDLLKSGDMTKILSMSEFNQLGGAAKVVGEGFSGAKVSGVKEGEAGVVNMTFTEKDGEADDVQFVQVENVWLPKDMADGWKEGVAEAKKGIQAMSFDANKKQQIMGMMPMIKMGLQNAKNATSKEQLGQSMMMAFMPMMMMGMGGIGGDDD